MTVHVSTDAGMRGKQRNCVLEVDNFGDGSVMMRGSISYAEKLNWCTSTATLTPLNTEMRF
jgi:hypothetical protein